MARNSKSQPTYEPEPEFVEEQDLLPAGLQGDKTSTANEINLKVQHVQEQLLDLKRQQEEVERQKRELEELSRKQRDFDEGRREIVEKLTHGLVLLERQEFEVKRELEQIKIVRDSFAEHLSQTENLNPSEWSPEEMPSELTKALARIDQAKAIYSQSRARLSALRQNEENAAEMPLDLPQEIGVETYKSFGAMVRDGFAYSLPLLVFTILILVGIFVLRH